MDELAGETHECIKLDCAEGDVLAGSRQWDEAVAKYEHAWELLREPKTKWRAATWILAAIGDAWYLAGEFERAREVLQLAMHCPDAIGNPFLHLRLGQCQFDPGNVARAGDELARAYMGGGAEILRAEDPRYFEFIKTILDEPVKGWE